jgi:hypothetical protein
MENLCEMSIDVSKVAVSYADGLLVTKRRPAEHAFP